MRAAAKLTGGAYARADRAADRTNLRATLAKVRSRMLSAQKSAERADRFQWPLALAVAMLLGDLVLAGIAGSAGRRGSSGRRRGSKGPPAQESGRNEQRCLGGRPHSIERSRWRVDRSPRRAAADASVPREHRLLAGLTRRAERRAALRRRRLRRLGQGARPSRSPRTARPSGPTTRAMRYYRMRRYEDAAVRYRLAAAGPLAVRQPSVFNLGQRARARGRGGARAGTAAARRRSRHTRKRSGSTRPIRTPSGISSWRSSGWRKTGWRAARRAGAGKRTTAAAT